eukprot:760767-Rhodomonas_salina.1
MTSSRALTASNGRRTPASTRDAAWPRTTLQYRILHYCLCVAAYTTSGLQTVLLSLCSSIRQLSTAPAPPGTVCSGHGVRG